jgi:hypothetical protein
MPPLQRPPRPAEAGGTAQPFRDRCYGGGYALSFHQDFCNPDHLAQFRSEEADDLLLSTRITNLFKMESNAIKRMKADKS